MKKVLYIQPRIEVVKIKEEYIMAGYSDAMTEEKGKTKDIPFNGQGTGISGTHDGAGIGAKRNFSIWEDDADDNMDW